MLRIFGVTYDHTINYGSCLQAFALQKSIEKIRVGKNEVCQYELIPLWTCKDYPKKKIKNILGLMLLKFYHRSFVQFERKYMRYANYNSIESLESANDNADAFVCGSDVIWNPYHNKGVSAYYLDFAQKYAFSYAASFGASNIDYATVEKVRPYLIKLNRISVREKSSLKLVQDITEKEAEVVVDPTLLLTDDDWSVIAPKRESDPYMFVYTTHVNTNITRIIDKVKEKTDLKVIIAEWDSSPRVLVKKGVFNVVPPERWLQLLRNAEYVVTNSFHATAFSVLFHKRFFTVVNGDKSKGINVRMNDFLNSIGLEDRIFSDIPDQLDLSEIDYTFVDKRIDEMRKYSLEFLQENLEAAYQQKLEREKQNGQHV